MLYRSTLSTTGISRVSHGGLEVMCAGPFVLETFALARHRLKQRHWLEALAAMGVPEGNGGFHVAGETCAVITIRRYPVTERVVTKDRVAFEGHRKACVSDWGHHEPLEIDE